MVDSDTLSRLRGLEPHLSAVIRGQDHILPRLAAGFCRGALRLTDPARPRACFFLVGPTGTGKTETFATAVKYVFGPGRLVTFDMSEYQDAAAVRKFLGENRDDPGLLGRALPSIPEGGLLFDEIEKAHPLVLDLFLQILWSGRVTVATGQTLSFAPYFLAFTSNLGSADAMRMAHSSVTSIEQAVLRQVGGTLRPEFVGRLDEQFVFARLSPAVQREICALETRKETTRLKHLGYDLTVSRDALEFLLREGFHPHLGARPLRRTVERHLQDAVTRALFASGQGSGEVVLNAEARRLDLRS